MQLLQALTAEIDSDITAELTPLVEEIIAEGKSTLMSEAMEMEQLFEALGI